MVMYLSEVGKLFLGLFVASHDSESVVERKE